MEVLRAVFLNRQVSSGNFVKEVEHSLSVCGVELVPSSGLGFNIDPVFSAKKR